ncbi:MAG TPA: YbaY family lipoprotein, partial [Burkholderiaceae bacterium]|nr:YbaY family lipoprotein [Burkholderiaceae bacterium]
MFLRLTCAVRLLMLLPLGAARAETVTGTATYLQRIALPPSAVFEASVQEVSGVDAAAEVIGSIRIENPGAPPIAFAIEIDPKRIDERRRYTVRATISVDGKLLLTTDRAYPVLTQGNGREVALLLRSAGGPRPTIVGGPMGLPGARPFRPLPASFGGDLPCADCEALRYRLNLFADRSYFLGTEYVGRKDGNHYDIGTWAVSADVSTLTLKGGREATELFRVVDARTLRKLMIDGRDIESKLNYALVRTPRFEPVEPRLPMRGMFRFLADAGSFTECLTGQRWPVASQGQNAVLEREYLKLRKAPGEPLLASVDGEVKLLPRMEGKGVQPMLVVHRLIGVSPGETCGPRLATAGLLDTVWVLTALRGQPVAAKPGPREPSLVLHSEQQRVAGSTGCNRLSGSYTL